VCEVTSLLPLCSPGNRLKQMKKRCIYPVLSRHVLCCACYFLYAGVLLGVSFDARYGDTVSFESLLTSMGLNSDISQKTKLFIVSAVRASDPVTVYN
jgi:hypothetical protein